VQIYTWEWKSVISFLQLQPTDFDTEFNVDYRVPGLEKTAMRGSETYNLPIGWYRHALKVNDKFPDGNVWLGHTNAEGEWPVAFHGTRSLVVRRIANTGVLSIDTESDRAKEEAMKHRKSKKEESGIHVATHCDGGAATYAETFTIHTPDRGEQHFKIVFQCRVKPGTFIIHKPKNLDEGHVWCVNDTRDIRPYGILLKAIDTKK
jgi:hypothetical protein